MILLPIIALLVGFLLPHFLKIGPVTGPQGQYLAVACLAGLDSVLGGIRSGLEGKFHNDVFLTGFVSNTLIAFFLAWLGDQIGLNLFLVAALVIGSRLFNNLSLIRRYLLTRWRDSRDRRRLRAEGS